MLSLTVKPSDYSWAPLCCSANYLYCNVVCVYVCGMSVPMHVHILCTCVLLHMCVSVCAYLCIREGHGYVLTCDCMCVYVYVYVCIYVCVY